MPGGLIAWGKNRFLKRKSPERAVHAVLPPEPARHVRFDGFRESQSPGVPNPLAVRLPLWVWLSCNPQPVTATEAPIGGPCSNRANGPGRGPGRERAEGHQCTEVGNRLRNTGRRLFISRALSPL
ncbi:hypothetical protein PRIPAC_94397 [Pristionchus pacificus]|uniref:Uncharacterized protein n=1 Tax=Pristionchus pacificus TaxID=54126 RepID=A0A2A6CIM2_PRIPA|nr:hypothetical protein PRIPAC_94397 [Pristionchus pacificus]|eukprot:PDM77928.1 hypothetical protein PRIPAC_34795 [Pristionchus pacificus]